MSRVNHKKVKQLLNEKRSKISDRQFFSSRILAGHFEDTAAAQTKRYNYNRRVRVSLYWRPRDTFVAATDNLHITINAGNSIVTAIRGRENRYRILTGLFAHELGHVLYTDFLANQTYANKLEFLSWYPEPPEIKDADDIRREKEFWEYVKADHFNLEAVRYIAHIVANILEDGYIENRILNNFPGSLGYGLEELRSVHFQSIETVTQLKEDEENGKRHIFESILQIMLSYAKYGEIKYGDEPLSDERIRTVFSLLSVIDMAILNHSGKQRLKAASFIMVRCWDYIREFAEICREQLEKAQNEVGYSDASVILSKALGSLKGLSGAGSGSSAPVSESGSGAEISATAVGRAKTKADAETADKTAADGKSAAEGSEKENGDTKEETGEAKEETDGTKEKTGGAKEETGEAKEEADEADEALPTFGSMSSNGKQRAGKSENGRIPLIQTERCEVPVGGGTEYNAEYCRELDENAAADIEKLLDKMAENAACVQLENERLRELNAAAESIDYGNIHSGVNIRINRITDVDSELIRQYDEVSAPLLNISRQLQKNILRQLKEERRGGKQTGLYMGRRLDTHTLHRNDGKVFYTNSLPNEIPQLAVGLLLDESGSMCSCHRCTYARAAAVILYDFCKSLDIPVMVYGHSTGYHNSGNTVELYSYAEFENYDRNDKYRMMDIAARGSNRDGAALRFVAERLVKRPEQVKMLIIVSDGQPADSGYYGTAAEEDLRGIKHEYNRRGILFIAAAIGDDKADIERIYGDSFLDITDLNQLPVKLTEAVRRHIRV